MKQETSGVNQNPPASAVGSFKEEIKDIRCPVGPRKLLAKMVAEGEKPVYVDGWAVEFACSDCARRKRQAGLNVSRVLHRFNLIGECVETRVQNY